MYIRMYMCVRVNVAILSVHTYVHSTVQSSLTPYLRTNAHTYIHTRYTHNTCYVCIIHTTGRLYGRLPEVQRQRREQEKKEMFDANRAKAKEYQKVCIHAHVSLRK